MSQSQITESLTMESVADSDDGVVTADLKVISASSLQQSGEIVVKTGKSVGNTGSSSLTTKDNIVVVVNKIEADKGGGQGTTANVKILQKPLTVMGSPVSSSIMLNKNSVLGNSVVKVAKSPTGTGTAIVKRNIVLASRPGSNQIITCAPGGQQPSLASTPVILTQKVVSGGVPSSPVVSTVTAGANAATSSTSSLGVNSKVVAPSPGTPRLQDVRVDNWGNYCLQRLQIMYEKNDFCDLTIRFHSSQEIKVHRVVVNLCTEYFSNLEKLYGLSEGILILPKDVEFQTMQTIIRFFYTGKLEVRGVQFNDIYRTVKMMNITILVKLLDAHSKKPLISTPVKNDTARTVMVKQAVDLGKGQKGHVQIQVGHVPKTSPVIALPVAGSKALQVATPGMKLPPGVKTKTVLARLQPQTSKSVLHTPVKVSGRKLPIWKDRKFNQGSLDHHHHHHPPLEKWQIKEEEPARPTRFEWGDPDEPDPFLTSTLTNHALMEKQKEKHSVRKAEDIFDTVKNQTQTLSGVKRTQAQAESSPKLFTAAESSPPPKIPKLDLHIPPDSPPSTSSQTKLDTTTLDLNEDTIVEEVTTTVTEQKSIEKKLTPILKPVLKSPDKGVDATKGVRVGIKDAIPQKTVRFAPEVEKENKEKQPLTTPKLEIPIISTEGGDLVNHSKIISEVLRKFPDLVKDNKNIKLKIVQKPIDGSIAATTSKDSKSKVSYIVLKSSGATDPTASTVLKKTSTPASASTNKFWETDKTPKKPSPAENTTGPWLCETCAEGENTALQFDTYYNFRRHLVDVHAERIDARICEYCGQKASKRNLLLYHLYTKHGVQPPKNCTFPHCDRCDYVALSESLLNKHKQNHDTNKEFCCTICNASFKSSTVLQAHMSANLHRNKDTKVYECPYCRKPFVRNINLKAHIRSLHRDVARLEEMEDPRLPPDDTLTGRIVTASFTKRRQFPSILASARASSNTSVVEFITSDQLHEGQAISYVTADGQPIEIIDPSALSSLPLTLVASDEVDGMATVSSPMETSIGLEGHAAADNEYVTGVTQEDGSQAIYVMDGAQGAVEIDMANMGLTLASDGTVVYDGDDASQNFIVQDMQGNQFRKMTGIDETGKPVVFLQMIGEPGTVEIAPTILDESITGDGNEGNSQIFVSSAGMTLPVTSDGNGQQVIYATSGDGTILDLVPTDSGSHQVVVSEAVLAAHGQQIEEQQHLQLVQQEQGDGMQEVIHDQMGQPVQELHIVLDQENNRTEGHEQVQQEGLEIVEVQQSDAYGEFQLGETYTQSDIQQLEHNPEHDTNVETSEHVEIESHDIHDHETQQIEVDECESSQLQIVDEPHTLRIESCETQEMEVDGEETQIVTEECLQESIEIVEGQTLTLVDDEDGTEAEKLAN